MDDARTVFLNCEEFNEDDSEVSHVITLNNLDPRFPLLGIEWHVIQQSYSVESPQVGQAGKRLFEFFERRWEELAPIMD